MCFRACPFHWVCWVGVWLTQVGPGLRYGPSQSLVLEGVWGVDQHEGGEVRVRTSLGCPCRLGCPWALGLGGRVCAGRQQTELESFLQSFGA